MTNSQVPARTAIVTGASGAIGAAVARALVGAGRQLVLADVSESKALAAQLRAGGAKVEDIPTDMRDPAAIRAMVHGAMACFGSVDILVTVAGVTSLGDTQTLPVEEWDRVLATNLRGVFLCCQAVIGPMRAQHFGRIVNIGSILAKNGGNGRPWIDRGEQARTANAAYCASKAGVHALTFQLAKELAGDGITANAVAPGPVASAMTRSFPQALRSAIPVGRLGEPRDVARAVCFLTDDDAGFITGEIIDVNGGMLMD